MNTIVIFSRRLAAFLVRHDCKIVDIRTDGKNTEKVVFVFIDTPKLQQLITEFAHR